LEKLNNLGLLRGIQPVGYYL